MDGSSPEVAEIYAPGLGGYGYGWFFGQGFNRKRARHNGMLPVMFLILLNSLTTKSQSSFFQI